MFLAEYGKILHKREKKKHWVCRQDLEEIQNSHDLLVWKVKLQLQKGALSQSILTWPRRRCVSKRTDRVARERGADPTRLREAHSVLKRVVLTKAPPAQLIAAETVKLERSPGTYISVGRKPTKKGTKPGLNLSMEKEGLSESNKKPRDRDLRELAPNQEHP